MMLETLAASDTHTHRAPVCLLLLCGLPGAGKTSLARALVDQAAQQGVDVRLISFDELGCQPSHPGSSAGAASSGAASSFDAAAWQQARQRAMEAVQAALRTDENSRNCSCDTSLQGMPREGQHAQQQRQNHPPPPPLPCRLVIADDNLQLRSMRWQCYFLAHTARAAALLVYVRCSEQTALQRNAARPAAQRVPAAVITRMAEKLEEPAGGTDSIDKSTAGRASSGSSSGSDGSDAGWVSASDTAASSRSRGPSWEAASLIVWDSNQALTPASVASLWRQVWQRWGPAALPLRDAEAEAAARSAAQAATAASLAHAVDVATRQVLSECMAQLVAAAQQQKRAVAQQLNAARRQLLQEAAAHGVGMSQLSAAAADGGAAVEQGAQTAAAEGGQGPGAGAGEAAVASAARRWAAAYRQRCERILQTLQPC